MSGIDDLRGACCSADQRLLPKITIAEKERESYIPSGIDVGIDFDDDRCTLLKTQEGNTRTAPAIECESS